MTPFQKALFFLAWSTERLASNCVRPAEDIAEIVADERPAYDGSLPIRVLEQRGVRFVVEGGVIVDAISPNDPQALRNIPASKGMNLCLAGLKRGPVVFDMASFSPGSDLDVARRNGLVDLGTVQETLIFNGEKETRSANRWAARLSDKGRLFLAMIEKEKESDPVDE